MNSIASNIFELLKYILPSIVVLVACYYIVYKFLTHDMERKRLAIFGDNLKVTLPLRLQAYERLTLFVERMQIQSLMGRYYNSQLSITEFQLLCIQNIRAEFEHNLTQQIYVSHEVWQTVLTAKEQEIAMINNIATVMPADATVSDFVQRLTNFVLGQESTTPSLIALNVINDEAKKVLLQA